MIHTIEIRTTRPCELIDITSRIQSVVGETGIVNGLCMVHVPHTTAGLTVNENADPSVRRDILTRLSKIVPRNNGYTHLEGNSDAHIKASMMGFTLTLMVENSRLVLGTWQGVYFAEFDGPRTRKILVKVRPD